MYFPIYKITCSQSLSIKSSKAGFMVSLKQLTLILTRNHILYQTLTHSGNMIQVINLRKKNLN